MVLTEHFPTHEVLGVFLGLSGYEWLSEGRADPLRAAAIALTAGAIIGFVRHQRRKRQER